LGHGRAFLKLGAPGGHRQKIAPAIATIGLAQARALGKPRRCAKDLIYLAGGTTSTSAEGKTMFTQTSKIAVVGAGAIGGVTAAFLQQAGYDLEVVCKHADLADRLRREGLHITGLKGAHRVKLKAVPAIADLGSPQDLVFLATKATECVAAARELIPFLKPDSVVVSLQNGICEHALAEVLGRARIVGCVVGWGASHNAPGELEVTSEGEFVIGNIDQQSDERLAPIQKMLGLVHPTRISANIMGELYSKLIVNACINSLGVIGGVTLGRLLADRKVRRLFLHIMREAMAVAAALGIRVAPGGGGRLDYYAFLEDRGLLADLKRHLTIRIIGFKYRRIKSSSLQSIERGRRSEIDFLNGYICDRGREQGVATPVNDAVRAMVHAIEEGRRPMTLANVHDPVFAGL
jgi:2-dehydropantoate 2-reductase